MNPPLTPRAWLDSRLLHGIKAGLDNIRFLLEADGNPHTAYPVVHIGGTNGKGSVAAMVQAIVQAAGLRTGRFTSPHLIDVNERYVIYEPGDTAAHLISGEDLDRHIAFFREVANEMDHSPTYFEICTAVAFRFFREAEVDLAVIEVGLGGRLDSTNVVEPEATAITNIDLEHMRYLGATLEEIAGEKAGIIKPGVPLVLAEQNEGPCSVILERASDLASPVRCLNRDFRYTLKGGPFAQQFSYEADGLVLGPLRLALNGSYQGENAAVAVTMADMLRNRFPSVTEAAMASGLANARWPCRLERVLNDPPVIVDATHTPAGARALSHQLQDSAVVLAISDDKPAERIIAALSGFAKELILTRYTGKRAMAVDALCAAANSVPYRRAESLEEAIEHGMSRARPDLPLVITGSVFTAGEARRILMERHGAPPPCF